MGCCVGCSSDRAKAGRIVVVLTVADDDDRDPVEQYCRPLRECSGRTKIGVLDASRKVR